MKKIHLYYGIVALVILATTFLRVYRIPETLMFLSDQGRDAIVLKRLVTLEKLVFVGPTTSIGNVFTGPFYYYLVAPFMLIAGLSPTGPAYGVAIINSIGLALLWYFVMKQFGKEPALVFLVIAAFSNNLIMQSRFSWNPNPLPYFALATLCAFFFALRKNDMRWFGLAGFLFGASLQLHYIAAAIPFGMLALLATPRSFPTFASSHVKHKMMAIAITALVCIASFTPLILFEVKNNFINTQTFLRTGSTGEIQAKNTVYMERLKDTTRGYFQHTFSLSIFDGTIALTYFVIAVLVVIALTWWAPGPFATFSRASLVVVIVNVLALSRLETGRHVHYFNPSYLTSYLLVAFMIHALWTRLRTRFVHISIILLLIVGLTAWTSYQAMALNFLTGAPRVHTQLTHARAVAKTILAQVTTDAYQVVGLPFYETEGHYRYYLELLGRRPMTADSLGDPKELFVICHELDKKECDIPGNAQWQLADFQNRHPDWRMAAVTQVEHVRIYKLVF